VQQKRNRGLGYWGWLSVIILAIVLLYGLLYAYRALVPAVVAP
jgi:hypothetical protein